MSTIRKGEKPTTASNLAGAQQTLTARFVKAISDGIANPGAWRKSWRDVAVTLPRNAVTGAYYKGGNSLYLGAQAIRDERTNLWFAGYEQWQAQGRQVRKGEKAYYGIHWSRRDDKRKGPREDGTFPSVMIPAGFKVFHYDQTDPIEDATKVWEPPTITPREWDDWSDVDAVIADTGALITYEGNRACYSPTTDSITMPVRDAFDTADGFYATLLHEVGHWTGHKDRLDRLDKIQRFGDNAYAYEELVAELTSAFALVTLGRTDAVQPREDHTNYLAGWLRALENDTTFVWKAAGDASRALDMILQREVATAQAA